MQDDARDHDSKAAADATAERVLPPAAMRALAEAAARREAARLNPPPAAPKEIGGRDGPDPLRYGDWEKNGAAVDF